MYTTFELKKGISDDAMSKSMAVERTEAVRILQERISRFNKIIFSCKATSGFYLNRFMRELRRRTSADKRRYSNRRYSNDQSALEKAHDLYFGNKDLRYKLKRTANEF